jgi:hypothetical protein
LNPHLLGPEELILRAHHASLLQFGHVSEEHSRSSRSPL